MSVRLLVVDDEVRFVETIAKRLSARGYDVTTACSGREALDRIATEAFDVMVLDVRMPGMDGLTVLREARAIRPLLQVVLLSGNASINAAVEGMRLGAVDYLLKPADLEELLARIEEAAERKRAAER